MANVTLGTLTFAHNPSSMPIIRPDKPTASVLTYTDVGYFAWAASYIGKIFTLKWEFMTATDFDDLNDLFIADNALSFYPNDGQNVNFTVNIMELSGDYFGDLAVDSNNHRQNVELKLLVRAVL